MPFSSEDSDYDKSSPIGGDSSGENEETKNLSDWDEPNSNLNCNSNFEASDHGDAKAETCEFQAGQFDDEDWDAELTAAAAAAAALSQKEKKEKLKKKSSQKVRRREESWDADIKKIPRLPIAPHIQFADAEDDWGHSAKSTCEISTTTTSLSRLDASLVESSDFSLTSLSSKSEKQQYNEIIELNQFPGVNYLSSNTISYALNIRRIYRRKRRELRKQTTDDRQSNLIQFGD